MLRSCDNPLGRFLLRSVMPKGRKTGVGIYHPRKTGMPYLVVTVSADGVVATAVNSKEEARVLASTITALPVRSTRCASTSADGTKRTLYFARRDVY